MGILSWIVLGLIAGGLILTIVLGIVGALLGGYIGTRFGYGSVTGFDLRSVFIAVGGALILLLAYRLLANRATA
jgi:uncharacterized membrane protein YeaQ/YmgE (transglycosylase-associated protein family)